METLRDYVNWNMTHLQNKSRNLFDKDNFYVHGTYYATNLTSTATGISFYTESNISETVYGQVRLSLGYAKNFSGKTITFSSPDIHGTVATKLAVMSGSSRTKNGSNFTKSGDVYYSSITLDDENYTSEVLCLILYFYGQTPNKEIVFNDIMVNKGSEVLPYEPYK